LVENQRRMAAWAAAGVGVAAILSLAGQLRAQTPQPEYPQGVPISRNATAQEKAWAAENPANMSAFDSATVPTGPLSCPGEYAPSDGIVFAWEGGSSLNAIQAQMIRHITTTGNAIAYIFCDSAGIATTARTTCVNAGADTNKIVTIVRTSDTIWLRDYGPRYTYEGDVRVIVDHTYNVLSRSNDNTIPVGFASFKKHKRYDFPMIHGGGNYHLNSTGQGQYTRLIANENTQYSESQINALWQQYWGPTNTYHNPYRSSVDGTQHIDMWMQIVGDNKVIISDWPNSSGSIEDVISDNAASLLTSQGWTVARTPSFSVGGTHYTYTNMVLCNNLALVPQYTNASVTMPNPAGGANLTIAQINANALQTYRDLLGPSYTVVGVASENIVGLSGVIHCIVMQVPVNKNGQNPGVYLRSPNGGATYNPGQAVNVDWISDDDIGVTSVDVQLSNNNGTSWITLASNVADTGSFVWTVPANGTTQGKFRVVARDVDGRTGSDSSDTTFTINAPYSPLAIASVSASDPGTSGTNNGNGVIEPGEGRIVLSVALRNDSDQPVNAISASLQLDSTTVQPLLLEGSYPNLDPAQTAPGTSSFVFGVRPSHPCGTAINCTLLLTFDGGTASLPFTIATGSPGGPGVTQQFSYTGAAVAIPDNSVVGASASIIVSGLAGPVADVDFRFDGTTSSTSATSTTVGLNHNYVGDLTGTLTGPTGVGVVLFANMGGGANSGHNFFNTRFDDESAGANSIQNAATGAQPFTGSWRPLNPLAAFDNLSANGTWTIKVQDLASVDIGSLRRFSLFITPRLGPVCAAALSRPPTDIASDDGQPLPNDGTNNGVTEGDYNCFFSSFFGDTALARLPADIADDAGAPLPSEGVNNGVTEGDYNSFFSNFFQ